MELIRISLGLEVAHNHNLSIHIGTDPVSNNVKSILFISTQMKNHYLALDFGGTKHAAAVITPGERQWLAYRRAVSPPNADVKSDLEIMFALAHELLTERQICAIGVSFGGPVDATTGTVRLSHHVRGWENTPLREMLEAEFGVSASVDNDANVAALGEYRFGAGRGYDSLLYITVSTGVGGGWILNGCPWRGVEGMAGENAYVGKHR